MKNYDEATYGENIAEVYDELYATYDPNTITTLQGFAQGGPALELAIGTGRIALRLQEAGVSVCGIDASPAMVQKLRAKPGGNAIPVSMGNFADVAVDGAFSLIYVIFNTFYALLTQEEQLRCFANVAKHLTVNGVFVIEGFVPDLARYTRGQNLTVVKIAEGRTHIDAAQHDLAAQTITSQHMMFTEKGVKMYPVKLRYAWPSELDLMAQLAGLKLVNRWANWKREPFTSSSGGHISVYALA